MIPDRALLRRVDSVAVSDSVILVARPDLYRYILRTVSAFRFIPPCRPIRAKEVPAGDDRLHEVKFDGYRVQSTRWARACSSTAAMDATSRSVSLLLCGLCCLRRDLVLGIHGCGCCCLGRD